MLNLAVMEFSGICLHSLFYGLYLLLFIACVYVLLFRCRNRDRIGRPQPMHIILLTVFIVLFFLITANWVLIFVVLLEQLPEPSSLYLGNLHGHLTDPRSNAANALCMTEIIVANLTMVYRLYFVWGRSKRITTAPLITASLSIAFAIVIVVNEVQSTVLAAYLRNDMRWITALCSLELVTNIMVTALLPYRIWSIEWGIKLVGQTRIKPVVNILVESAAVFTVFLILIPASVLTQSQSLTDLALNQASPAIGIAFSLIIIRVGRGKAIEERVSSGRINTPIHTNPVITFGEG